MIPVACKPVRAPRGFTMLELMISLVLVAVGLLGFASLQLSSMQRIEQAKASQMSNELLRELSEQVSSMSELVQKNQRYLSLIIWRRDIARHVVEILILSVKQWWAF